MTTHETDHPDTDDDEPVTDDLDADAEPDEPPPGPSADSDDADSDTPDESTDEAEPIGSEDDLDREPIALGPSDADATTAEEVDAPAEATDEVDELAAEPVIVELDETDVEVLDDEPEAEPEVADYTVADDPDAHAVMAAAVVVADDEAQPLPVPEPSPVALLEPVGLDTPLDPGSGTYHERWSAIQGSFVDEPLRAVESAGSLVAQVWHEFERTMAQERDALDHGWTAESSTDDLRAAFRQYRELFRRLTTLFPATD